ncbi:phosphatase PAP2 family protein [Candidatus Saccharibacteria bacterium]|nr:phosphatase PAP2 family protein [Candidatus Saccharibacteria bacterium]
MKSITTQISRFDLAVTRQIRTWPSSLDSAMTGASLIGRPATVTLVGLALLGSTLWQHHYNIALVALAALGSLLFSALIKVIWQRTRPDTAAALGLHTYSFPSGHSYGSLVMYGLLAFLAAGHLAQVWNSVIPLLFTLLIIMIGLSRVYLGAHYPTDILGGWCLGLLVLVLIIKVGQV